MARAGRTRPLRRRAAAVATAAARLNSVSAKALKTASAALTDDQATAALTWDRMQSHAVRAADAILGKD